CHGVEGENVANGISAVIKDMNKEDFIAALKGYKDGTYGGKLKGLMKGQVMRLSENDFQSLAEKIVK
ncbi:MAG: cytochrome C, partial [Campylobacteraceae bacterium]|nr:cytochrome C [Campylobacteraceae bacterium]